MKSQQLPERANLEQLKKQAKSLFRDARAKDAAALERFQILPALAQMASAEAGANLALHDAQFVIAREHGFKSWKELHEEVEERSMGFAAAADEFVRCATGNAPARAFRLLERYPAVARASLYSELVLGDVEAASAMVEKNPELAGQAGGIQKWEPILYICHTCLHQKAPERAAGLVGLARELLKHGANPNAEYHWDWHPELPWCMALWGALCAVGHLPLAEVLLEGGANPTDGVSTQICAGSNNIAALELLNRFGANVNGKPGGPPLPYVMTWAGRTLEGNIGVRWLIEHGADPKLSFWESGDTALHVAAQRWDVPTVELLVRHGADIHQRRADGRTAHTLAALHGNEPVAAWLLAHGAKDECSLLEKFVSACTRGDGSSAREMLAAHPNLRGELRPEHHLMMHGPSERGHAAVLEVMLACGFDPNAKDKDGVAALHRAAMGGRVEAVRTLLAHGASVNNLDGMFAGTPLLWAMEGRRHGPSAGADHVEVARLLIAAGSSKEWNAPENAPDVEGAQEQLIELCRAAAIAPS